MGKLVASFLARDADRLVGVALVAALRFAAWLALAGAVFFLGGISFAAFVVLAAAAFVVFLVLVVAFFAGDFFSVAALVCFFFTGMPITPFAG
jgi:hypothetical protein